LLGGLYDRDMSYGALIPIDSPERKVKEILERFELKEGTINFYYGKVRNGKTYAATADIIELLSRGEIVIANWDVKFDYFDERESFWHVFFKTLVGKRYFYRFDSRNFYYFAPDSPRLPLVQNLRKEIGVHIFIDEGQWVLNSHVRSVDEDSQKLVLTNGHYFRSLNIISQRAGNVIKDYRSQVTFWYLCQKKLSWPFVVFQKTIIEDMVDDYPDEESDDNKRQVYFANRRVFEAYNTHGMRQGERIREREFEVYRLSFGDKIRLMVRAIMPARTRAPLKRARRVPDSIPN